MKRQFGMDLAEWVLHRFRKMGVRIHRTEVEKLVSHETPDA